MNRWIGIFICAIVGLALLAVGLVVPAHLRAVDASVLGRAGRGTSSLVEHGMALVREGHIGAATLLAQAATSQQVTDHAKLSTSVEILKGQHPDWEEWGAAGPNFEVTNEETNSPAQAAKGFTDIVIRQRNREAILKKLESSQNPLVQRFLEFRSVTNTTVFPPSSSASGQALDAALAIAGSLVQQSKFSPVFSNSVYSLAQAAVQGAKTESFEQILLDLMSLGQRLTWDQLTLFVAPIQDPEVLRLQSNLLRKEVAPLPVLFSAVEVSQDSAAVAHYLVEFSQSGPADLATSLRYGAGGVSEFVKLNRRLSTSGPVRLIGSVGPMPDVLAWMSDLTWRAPMAGLALKWALLLGAGLMFGIIGHLAKPTVSELERPLQVRGIHIAREILFALGFLVVILLFSEPFLTPENQKVEFPFRLHLPTVGSVVATESAGTKPTLMKQNVNLLPLVIFFILQGLIYIACVVKLAEIRRQNVLPRVKLRLLENEEHLFDAGLYLGFVGTIISFIVFSLGVTTLSIMSAYSSTSFGIIFVSFFKIFHLRPARRKLLMESETFSGRTVAPEQTLVTAP